MGETKEGQESLAVGSGRARRGETEMLAGSRCENRRGWAKRSASSASALNSLGIVDCVGQLQPFWRLPDASTPLTLVPYWFQL